jgi:hypothetical protein
MTDELERTLKASEDARAALTQALDRALTELEKATQGKRDFEADRAKLLEETAKAMEAAEQVRREGIEALEEARDLRKKLG